ncbi:MAG: hypothetical protein ACK4K8_06965 [Pannonibacter sp.]
MKWYVILMLALGLIAPPSAAEAYRYPEEFHIISRDNMNRFRGSHQLLRRAQDGFAAVIYCDTTYWVRPRTVAWTEQEAERGYTLAIETNSGNGWAQVCLNPQNQVRLRDLELNRQEERAATSEPAPRKFRFQEIRRAFESR